MIWRRYDSVRISCHSPLRSLHSSNLFHYSEPILPQGLCTSSSLPATLFSQIFTWLVPSFQVSVQISPPQRGLLCPIYLKALSPTPGHSLQHFSILFSSQHLFIAHFHICLLATHWLSSLIRTQISWEQRPGLFSAITSPVSQKCQENCVFSLNVLNTVHNPSSLLCTPTALETITYSITNINCFCCICMC